MVQKQRCTHKNVRVAFSYKFYPFEQARSCCELTNEVGGGATTVFIWYVLQWLEPRLEGRGQDTPKTVTSVPHPNKMAQPTTRLQSLNNCSVDGLVGLVLERRGKGQRSPATGYAHPMYAAPTNTPLQVHAQILDIRASIWLCVTWAKRAVLTTKA